MIRAIVSGKLASDPARKVSAAGKPYTVASMRADTDGDAATWARVLAFGDAAERLAGLSKGDAISAAGTLRVGIYRPKDGSDARPDLSLFADELVSVRRRPKDRPPRDDQGDHFHEGEPT